MSELPKVVAIGYFGRSGSLFLQSLLDNHPDCSQIPGCSIMGISDWWNSRREPTNKTSLIRDFLSDYDVLFDAQSSVGTIGTGPFPGVGQGLDKMGPNRSEKAEVDRDLFESSLWTALESEHPHLPEFFVAIHRAYDVALGRDPHPNRTIVFQLHTLHISRARFLNGFETKVVRIVREPAESAASHMRMGIKNAREEYPLRLLASALLNYGPLEGFETNSIAIRLEDVHTNPESTLRTLCEWLDLRWDESLLSSTFNGKQWWNVNKTIEVSGFNSETTAVQLSQEDRNRLSWLVSHLYDAWEYPRNKGWNFSFAPFDFELEYRSRPGPLMRALIMLRLFITRTQKSPKPEPLLTRKIK